MVAQLLQGRDAGQVCVGLSAGLKARSEDPVAEETPVQLQLQRRRRAEQRPVQAGGQVAVDDLLRPSQDERAGQTGELHRSLFS